jgi:hypothetical protein
MQNSILFSQGVVLNPNEANPSLIGNDSAKILMA